MILSLDIRKVSFQWYTHLISKEYSVYSYHVDYVNFCFAYAISLLHNSRQNKKSHHQKRVSAPNPSVKCSCNLQETLLSAGRKLHSKYGTCFNYINTRLAAKSSFCYHCIHSLTSSFCDSVVPKELPKRQDLGAPTSHTPSPSQEVHPMIWPDVFSYAHVPIV